MPLGLKGFQTGNTLRLKHGYAPAKKQTPTYLSWQNLKARTLNPNHIKYANYGGRGITVCDRWLGSFQNFLNDMGERPNGTSIDRIDNNLGYFKDNCRWATPKQQAQNRR